MNKCVGIASHLEEKANLCSVREFNEKITKPAMMQAKLSMLGS